MEDMMKAMLEKKKGLILREFEKICPTDASFHRMRKEMHNIFDDMEKEIKEIVTVK